MLPATMYALWLSLVEKMSDSPDNPFRSPRVPSQADEAAPIKGMGLVGLTGLLFLIAALMHLEAAILIGYRLQTVVGVLTLTIGFIILLPSHYTWLIGLAYTTLMAILSVWQISTGMFEDHPLLLFGYAPLIVYVVIMVLLIQNASVYYWKQNRKE